VYITSQPTPCLFVFSAKKKKERVNVEGKMASVYCEKGGAFSGIMYLLFTATQSTVPVSLTLFVLSWIYIIRSRFIGNNNAPVSLTLFILSLILELFLA
jgi:hypothetical protein